MSKVLLIEDEKSIASALKRVLEIMVARVDRLVIGKPA